MYNILVTDDEQIVIDSLSFIINKNFEGSVNVSKALSGTEALEIVTRENIDIIFMDINMPGLNGLETVSCIKKLKPQTVIIILSAFDRFQYAQEAMNLGAFKYITKPVNRNIVIQTIRSAMDFIDTRKGNQNTDDELHKKLDMVSPMIENDFIYSCIYNSDKKVDISSYLKYFNLQENPWCFICLEFPNINSENQYDTYVRIREIANEIHHCLVSSFMMNRIIIFYPVKNVELDEAEFEEEIKKLYSSLCYKISAGIRAGVGRKENDTELLSDSYNDSLSALNKVPSGGGIIFSGKSGTLKTVADSTQEFKKQILNKLRQGDANSVKSYLDLYCSQINAFESDLDKIKTKFFELIVMSKNILDEENSQFKSDSFENAFTVLRNENDFGMLKDFLQKTLLEFTLAINSVRKSVENPVIKKVCDYINENLSQEISLEQMADYANVSSFYLSKLFKEEKGITFINFLTDKRLDKARQLLNCSDLSVKEITAEIGYNDQNYFSRLFKNKFGVTPTEFRGMNNR